MIENVNLLVSRFVNQGIGILAGVDFRNRLERLQIDHARLGLFAVGGKTATQLRNSDKAMHAGRAADLTCDGVLRQI